MHQVGGPPIQMRQDRRGVGGNQPADHQAHKAHGQEFQHGRERAVMADQVGIGMGKRGFDGGEIGVNNDGAERGNDPRPGPQHIMRQVEEERAPERILLRLGGQHALGDVAAAARLRARIPVGPPADGDGHDEDHQRQLVHREVGQDVEDRLAGAVNRPTSPAGRPRAAPPAGGRASQPARPGRRLASGRNRPPPPPPSS